MGGGIHGGGEGVFEQNVRRDLRGLAELGGLNGRDEVRRSGEFDSEKGWRGAAARLGVRPIRRGLFVPVVCQFG